MTDKPALREVLSFYGVDLHGSRREQSVKCPVHEENRASCSVNEDAGLIHCQACGFGGDVWSLIMKKEGFSEFRSAVEWAGEHLGHVAEPGSRATARGKVRGQRGGFRPSYRKRPLSQS